MQCEEVVVARRGVLDVLPLSVKRTDYLRPLVKPFRHPVVVATVSGERLHVVVFHLAHGIGYLLQGHRAAAAAIQPERASRVCLLEYHAVPTLVQVTRTRVHVPWNGQAAVVVRAVNAVSVIPVVEVHPHLSVCVKVETYHGVLAPLVHGSLIVTGNGIAQHAMHVGKVLQLLLPLLQAVGFRSWHAARAESDVSVCLCEVVVALLAVAQPSVQLVRHFPAFFVQGIEVVIIGITALVVAHPYWCASALVDGNEVIHTVAALHPVQEVVFQQFVALHWIDHPARHAPLLRGTVEGHRTCRVLP